ncbi:MAG: UPF0175 family protein [Chloroflexota bacterium]
MMNATISLEMPVTIVDQLTQSWGNVSRRILETIAVEAYRTTALSSYDVQVLLGFSSGWETEVFLKEHQVTLHDTENNVVDDVYTMASPPSNYSLDDLLGQITEDNLHTETEVIQKLSTLILK